ncbi:PorP/SprF family type IX secretion system membrane protein [Formosa haliotis]|uniref:PorP/SprF family type IX secretion system membrane protein n=1 Tax=Formosa haliotis TaxID=1555194 RepID=UPI000825DA06|nr:type IX secretion system membrane protein PorP/SprF [Formosa haliotis]
MIKKHIILFFIVQVFALGQICAQENPVLSLSVPSQNNLKYNRFLQNPTFTFVREHNTNISAYNRSQWVGFNDAPKVYIISYSGKFTEKAGLGFGLFQQNMGVISSFGALANYAYNIKLNNELDLTLGFNFAYYNSGLNRNKIVTSDQDPLIAGLDNTSLLSIQPGINLSYKQFDFGLYAENLVDFDFSSTKLANDYVPKSFIIHGMYTHPLQSMEVLLEEATLQGLVRTRFNEVTDFDFGASAIFDAPKLGWLQTGYDSFYGISAGLGVHLSKRISIGYTYEKGIKNGISNFGSTHEFNIAFAIKHERKTDPFEAFNHDAEKLIEEYDVLNATSEKDNLLADIEVELDENTLPFLENLLEDETLTPSEKIEVETRITNLKTYADRAENVQALGKNAKPIVLRNANATQNKIVPKTVEDLKNAKDGYYLVSTPKEDINNKTLVNIKRYDILPEAISALNDKTEKGEDKDLYIIHVDNEDEQNPKTVPAKTDLQIAQEKADEEVRNRLKLKGVEDLRQSPSTGVKLEMKDIPQGYYIVANVFSDYTNAINFKDDLLSRGLDPDSFINPKNNYMYVYLKRFDEWQDALISYYTNVNHKYFDDIWIMPINTNETNKN